METSIRRIFSRQILDSRGRPTVEVDVTLADGSVGRASVPSGASTGSFEAHELRDGNPEQYEGMGVLNAVVNVNGEIARSLLGRNACDQRAIDERLLQLDGTPQLRRLGANATLCVSLGIARAVANSYGQLLFQRIVELADAPRAALPVPMVNILSGGLHANGGMDVQDFLAVPLAARTMEEAIRVVARVRSAADDVAKRRGLSTLLAAEGGLSPGFESGREALEMMVESIECAGLKPGQDVGIAIDVAATGLRDGGGRYWLRREGRHCNSEELIELIAEWLAWFPIVSVEDALAEEDWTGWRTLTAKVGGMVQLVGDDLFATHPLRLERGIRETVANAVLVKANQNGTLTGALGVIAQAKQAGYATIVSARSGETEDTFMSDLAVGSGAGQIKIGSLRTSSTVSKYNQLLRIEEACSLPYAGVLGLAGRCWKRPCV